MNRVEAIESIASCLDVMKEVKHQGVLGAIFRRCKVVSRQGDTLTVGCYSVFKDLLEEDLEAITSAAIYIGQATGSHVAKVLIVQL